MAEIGIMCSDAHLRRRRGDEQYAWQQIIDAAIERGLPIIAAGDMFDRQSNRAAVVTSAYRELDRLAKAELAMYYTEGQHDIDSPSWFSGHRAARHIHKKTVEFGGRTFYGLNWQAYGDLQEALGEIPKSADTLVCHQVWANWMGERTNPQGSFAEIPKQIRFVQTGDLHEWKWETHENAGGFTMNVLSTGATTQQKINEPANHFYAILHADGTIKKKKLKSRVFVDCGLFSVNEDVNRFAAECEGLVNSALQQAVAAELPEAVAKPLFRFRYSSKIDDAERRILKLLAGRVHVHIAELPPPEKTLAYATERAKKLKVVTPTTMLPEAVDKEERPVVFGLCERLLAASDPSLELAKWKAEFLGEIPKEDQ